MIAAPPALSGAVEMPFAACQGAGIVVTTAGSHPRGTRRRLKTAFSSTTTLRGELMTNQPKYEMAKVDTTLFDDLVGEDIMGFIFEHAPTKVTTRVARALDHYARTKVLIEVDEAMGAIRLIAAEEELVVAIFEWLKLRADQYPDHRDFVRKFKNHVVKLSFHPVLLQFRFIMSDWIKNGISPMGLEGVRWTVKPVVDGQSVKMAILNDEGKELIRHNPLAIDISREDDHGLDAVPHLLAEFVDQIKEQHAVTLKEFLTMRADFRNKLMYASDAGSWVMDDKLTDLIDAFKPTYRDLLWVLAILINGEPLGKGGGIVSQFIALYREVLIVAGVLRADNSLVAPEA